MGTIVAIILLVLVIGLAIFAVARSVQIVPQARAGIVERFGRYHRTLYAGLNVPGQDGPGSITRLPL